MNYPIQQLMNHSQETCTAVVMPLLTSAGLSVQLHKRCTDSRVDGCVSQCCGGCVQQRLLQYFHTALYTFQSTQSTLIWERGKDCKLQWGLSNRLWFVKWQPFTVEGVGGNYGSTVKPLLLNSTFWWYKDPEDQNVTLHLLLGEEHYPPPRKQGDDSLLALFPLSSQRT